MATKPNLPVIPETITVHLGKPDQPAQNVTVPFTDYIKSVASSEIYPTWPENSLRANIYAIVSFALNRVYTEYYRSRGYDFDITSSTQFDQAYKYQREIFSDISKIVDDIFNDYVVKQGSVEPYFTQFCNGTTVTCDGLSQWGTVPLAEQGKSPYEILTYYYGNDINLVRNAPVDKIPLSYPGTPLKLGDSNNDVFIIQNQLNRIRRNFPAIPRINSPKGVFTVETDKAVKEFQRIFNLTPDGIVGKGTWYKIKEIFNSVKKLSELNSEGLQIQDVTPPFVTEIKKGSKGEPVSLIQYYLSVIGYFTPTLPVINIDGDFGQETEDAVFTFQSIYGLPITGNVGRLTWNKMQELYLDIVNSLPENYFQGEAKLYPGYFLSLGLRNNDVLDLQKYLNTISSISPKLSKLPITGYFGTQTEADVKAFQGLFGLPTTGTVGPVTWNKIAQEYNNYIRK